MARARLYVAKGDTAVVISRRRLRTVGGRVVERSWPGLVETVSTRLDPDPPRSRTAAATVVLPPLLAALIVMGISGVVFGVLAGIVVFFAMSYLHPAARRPQTLQVRRASADTTRVLTGGDEQMIFARAVRTADRISETWPALGALVDVAEADGMLVEALWELSAVLIRRQDLRRVLADLSRPEFAGLPADDDTVRQLHQHRHTARLALAAVDAEVARREANLVRAEKAGLDFIRDQKVRRAIRAAEQSLEGLAPPVSGDGGAASAVDSGAGLAERTATVLAAYRELTTGPYQPPAE